MKALAVLILIGLFAASCVRDIKSDVTKSPSGKYLLNATVNRTNAEANDYAEVLIHIYTPGKIELMQIHSKAGDVNKWALGWTTSGDTIVLQSSDIGNKAWTLIADTLSVITLTPALNHRAGELYSAKYNKR
jgi:hypothetical protein